jgi:cell division initiation protein
MRRAPSDLLSVDFPRTLRGFDPDAVRDYLSKLALEMESVRAELERLKAELELKDAEVARLAAQETAVGKSLVAAHQNAEEIKQTARADAERILVQAQRRASVLEREAQEKADALHQSRRAFEKQFRAMLEGYLSDLEPGGEPDPPTSLNEVRSLHRPEQVEMHPMKMTSTNALPSRMFWETDDADPDSGAQTAH